jgi:hypothetical protein
VANLLSVGVRKVTGGASGVVNTKFVVFVESWNPFAVEVTDIVRVVPVGIVTPVNPRGVDPLLIPGVNVVLNVWPARIVAPLRIR